MWTRKDIRQVTGECETFGGRGHAALTAKGTVLILCPLCSQFNARKPAHPATCMWCGFEAIVEPAAKPGPIFPASTPARATPRERHPGIWGFGVAAG